MQSLTTHAPVGVDLPKVRLEVRVHFQEAKRVSIYSCCIANEIIENNDVDLLAAKGNQESLNLLCLARCVSIEDLIRLQGSLKIEDIFKSGNVDVEAMQGIDHVHGVS